MQDGFPASTSPLGPGHLGSALHALTPKVASFEARVAGEAKIRKQPCELKSEKPKDCTSRARTRQLQSNNATAVSSATGP